MTDSRPGFLRLWFPLGWWCLPIVLALGGGGFVFGFFVPSGANLGSAFEGAALTMLGALFARGFLAMLIHFAAPPDSSAGEAALTWMFLGFFFSPLLLIEIVVWLCGKRFLSSVQGLLLTGALVGAGAGMMDGSYQVHRGSGAFPFPFDVTWGLSGTTNGCFLHMIDAGKHITPAQLAAGGFTTTRNDSHQYNNGFAVKPTATFTEGSVMSNFKPSVMYHEMLHTYQNRVLGPMYTISYLLWMAMAFLPAVVAGLMSGNGFNAIYAWCYVDNPFEAMAYAIGGGPGVVFPLRWDAAMWIIVSVPFYLHVVRFLIKAAARLWWDHEVFRIWNLFEPTRGILPTIVAIGHLTVAMALLGTTAGAAVGGVLGGLVWLSCFLPVASDAFCANLAVRIYKLVLGWSSWLMPLCWPAHALGLLAFLINLPGIHALRIDWRTGSVASIGGLLAQLPSRGFTIGGFSFVNADRLTRSRMLHEAGHALNHAAYGFLHLFHFARFSGRESLWERMAESHVPPGLRRSDSYEQEDDWPRLRLWGPGSTSF